MTFSQHLLKLRKERGLKQTELAPHRPGGFLRRLLGRAGLPGLAQGAGDIKNPRAPARGFPELIDKRGTMKMGREAGSILFQVERGEAHERAGNHRVTYARACGYPVRVQPKEITAPQ